MTIELLEGRYFAQMAFVSWGTGDWLAALWKDPGKPFVLTYRVRFRRDNKLWDSDDRKEWTTATHKTDTSEDDAVTAMDHLMDKLVSKAHALGASELLTDKLILRSADIDQNLAALLHKGWAHGKWEGSVGSA